MNQSNTDLLPMDNLKHTIWMWIINFAAWCLAIAPVLQFFAFVLAIIVSISTLILNFDKIFSRFFKKH